MAELVNSQLRSESVQLVGQFHQFVSGNDLGQQKFANGMRLSDGTQRPVVFVSVQVGQLMLLFDQASLAKLEEEKVKY